MPSTASWVSPAAKKMSQSHTQVVGPTLKIIPEPGDTAPFQSLLS